MVRIQPPSAMVCKLEVSGDSVSPQSWRQQIEHLVTNDLVSIVIRTAAYPRPAEITTVFFGVYLKFS